MKPIRLMDAATSEQRNSAQAVEANDANDYDNDNDANDATQRQ